MESFSRYYSQTGEPLEVQILDPVGTGLDAYREVRLLFSNGRRYRAGFWLDPKTSGGHWWEEAGMAIVQDFTTAVILSAVDEVLEGGRLEETFEAYPQGD